MPQVFGGEKLKEINDFITRHNDKLDYELRMLRLEIMSKVSEVNSIGK